MTIIKREGDFEEQFRAVAHADVLYRSVAARFLYLSQDRADIQFGVRESPKRMCNAVADASDMFSGFSFSKAGWIGNATKTEVLFQRYFRQDKTPVFVVFRFEPASENENFELQNQSFQHGSFQNMLVLKHFASSGYV